MTIVLDGNYSTTYAGSSIQIGILSADRRYWLGALTRVGMSLALNDAPTYLFRAFLHERAPREASIGPIFALTDVGLMVQIDNQWRVAIYDDWRPQEWIGAALAALEASNA